MSLLRRFIARLSSLERFLLIGCIVLTIGTSSLWGYQRWLEATTPVPIAGGSYTEGVVAASVADVQPTIEQLTNVGFVRFDATGTIVPAAATKWDVTDDGKRYTFTLYDSLDKAMVEQAIADHRDTFPDIETQVTDEHTVIFTLKQSFAPFLATTAAPIFPLGPFEVAERERGTVRLVARPNALLGQPYLEELTLKIYPDSFNLTQALSAGDIEGVADISSVENDRLLVRMETYELRLPRKIFLFFNTERPALKSADVRRKLRDNQALETPIDVTLVTLASPRNEELAQQIVTSWKELGVRVTVETRTATELNKDVVPNRSYDALIYGLDFGADPDPYPFWHSSQIEKDGLNLSNFANIDADRLLEQARQSTDQVKRSELYGKFQEIFTREVPAIELEQITVTFATDTGLQGVASLDGRTVADRYSFITDWYRKTRRDRTGNVQ
ncbi:ABC transporter substrate-binding protein [Candidatus Berkelbacteria bacterium]|nr:ABC transporter substrate-binding protein [Candidatus Berkelbacteria bacterium]